MAMNHSKEKVLPEMPGNWIKAIRDISAVDAGIFSGKHQSCPMCGGTDRFRFDDCREVKGDGGYICSGCGAGKGLDLLMGISGIQFSEAIDVLGDWLGQVPVEVRRAARKEVMRDAGKEKYGQYCTPEKCAEFIAKCETVNNTPVTLCEGISPEEVHAYYRGGEIVATCVSVSLSTADGVMDEPCDVAMISNSGEVAFLSRGFPHGGVSEIPSDNPRVYLCSSWADGWHTHYATGGSRVWICWSAENLNQVAHRCKGMDLRVSCHRDDLETLHAADMAGLQVVIPDGRWSKGMVRKVFSASELLSH